MNIKESKARKKMAEGYKLLYFCDQQYTAQHTESNIHTKNNKANMLSHRIDSSSKINFTDNSTNSNTTTTQRQQQNHLYLYNSITPHIQTHIY